MEREAGIEPASLAWKAKVLPLNYSRPGSRRGSTTAWPRDVRRVVAESSKHSPFKVSPGGGGWIRTSVGVSQQIYSLPPLATRAPLRGEPGNIPRSWIDSSRHGATPQPKPRCSDHTARHQVDRWPRGRSKAVRAPIALLADNARTVAWAGAAQDFADGAGLMIKRRTVRPAPRLGRRHASAPRQPKRHAPLPHAFAAHRRAPGCRSR